MEEDIDIILEHDIYQDDFQTLRLENLHQYMS